VRDITAEDWQSLAGSRQSPTAVYVWASWSRESIDLFPTILELEREYEGRGVEFLYVSLDVDDAAEAEALMQELGARSSYRIAAPLEEAVAALGVSEPPAIIGSSGGTVQSMVDGDALSPEDAAALIEALLADQL
jgi:thiol-disulfide isomerase/thioredoxin